MIYIFKTHPFNMTFDEIKKMTFKQALILIEEYSNSMTEKYEAMNKAIERNRGNIFPVFDVTRGIFDV